VAKYLLTSISGFPLLVKCSSLSDIEKLKVKNSVLLSAGSFKKTKRNWTQEVSRGQSHIAESVNNYLEKLNLQGDYECWLRKQDASDKA